MTAFKTCTYCRAELPRTAFKLRKDGTHAAYCGPCSAAYQKAYSKKHSAKKTKAAVEWNTTNRERRKEIANAWSKRNYDPSKIDKAAALHRYREWRAVNLERAHANEKRYRQRNPERIRYAVSLRRSGFRKPSWFGELDELVLREAYALAKLRGQLTGVLWHVDHVVPLAGKTVSGLHCAANVAVIPARINLLKSNRVWPDQP